MLDDLNREAVDEVLEGMYAVFEDFPEARKTLAGFETFEGESGLKTRGDGTVFFNREVFKRYDTALLVVELSHSDRNEFGIVSGTLQGLGAHEAGHLIELALIFRYYPDHAFAWDNCILAKDVLNEVHKHIKDTPVSNYGTTDRPSEKLAEAVSDYYTNKHPKEISRAIVEELKKRRR